MAKRKLEKSDESKATKEELQKALQEKSIQLLLLDQELKKIEEQYRLLDQQIINIQLTRQNLDKIKDADEILASFAEGVFVKASLADKQKVLVNVGKGIVVEKSIEEAKKILDSRLEDLAMAKVLLSKEAERILNEIEAMEKAIKEFTSS